MQASSTSQQLQSLRLPSLPFSGTSACPKLEPGLKKRVAVLVRATKRDAGSGRGRGRHDRFKGKLVDANMIALRIRIKEMMEKEEEEQQQPQKFAEESEEWMEWDREYWCRNYKSNEFQGIGFLQPPLMNSRPCLVVRTVSLLISSASTSLAFLLCNLLEFLVSMVTYFSPF